MYRPQLDFMMRNFIGNNEERWHKISRRNYAALVCDVPPFRLLCLSSLAAWCSTWKGYSPPPSRRGTPAIVLYDESEGEVGDRGESGGVRGA